ncbi:inverted formin-2-like [Oculina patagonica]
MSSFAVKRKWSSLKRQLSDGDQGSWLSNEASPEFCVRLLRFPSFQTYCGIHSKLKSSSNEWMVEFLESNGMEVLLAALEKLSSLKLLVDAVMLVECTSCIKTVMNSRTGLDFMVGNRDFTRRLGRVEERKTLVSGLDSIRCCVAGLARKYRCNICSPNDTLLSSNINYLHSLVNK